MLLLSRVIPLIHHHVPRASIANISTLRAKKMADLPETFDGPLHTAIIGGTGLSTIPSFTPIARLPFSHPALQTPWGQPSAPILVLSHPRPGQEPYNVAFLSRHGEHHEFSPHEVNSQANIAALRKLGVRSVVAFSAVGSLKVGVRPRDFLVPHQVIDRTKGVRPWTFFEGGMVGHVGFADPFDEKLREVVIQSVKGKGILEGDNVDLHDKGLLVCMEGPQFSTRAESHLYRSWGASVINMSCLPESKLAREAEIGYTMICMSTDYDCWHESNEPVTVEMVMGHMAANAINAKNVVSAVLSSLGEDSKDDLVKGKEWDGQSKFAAGMTKAMGRKKEALDKLEWLFPGYFS